MNAITFRFLGLSPAGLLLSLASQAQAQVVAPISADIGVVPSELVAPARIDPALAAEAIQTRTLPNVWEEEGELNAMRRILTDPAKRAHAVGHFAEDDFVANNPTWHKTAAANAPENDVWRWVKGNLEGGQIKTHADGNAADYLRDMFADSKAENFFVPDDHVKPLVQKIQQQIAKADVGGNERVTQVWRRQLARVKPLGRSYAELESAVTRSAKGTVRFCALKGAGGAAAFVLAADGAVICYRSANGELTPEQVQEAGTEAAVKAGAVGLATYGVIALGANPVDITVIVVGGVVYVVADYAINELRPMYASSPMTTAEIDEVMPIGWKRDVP